MEKTYSIIIPHHNIPNLLERLLNSIPERKDIEVLIVDDNSSPENIAFLKKIEGRAKIFYISAEDSKGAGKARNIGLENAHGKWVLFADSDDFFEEDFVDILDRYVNVEDDIIFFTSSSVDSDSLIPVNSRTEYANVWVRENNLPGLRYQHFVPWSKMVKRSLIVDNNIRFEEVEVSNDAYFSVLIGIKANSVKAVDACIYVSTVRQGSLFHTNTEHMARKRFGAKIRISKLLIDNKLSNYKPNLVGEAGKGKAFSILIFSRYILMALRSEGIYWFLKDFFQKIHSKHSSRK